MQLSAGHIATYFKDERVEDIVRWLSLACFLNSITSPATALTQRSLRFKQLGMVQIASYFIGYILVGLPMAYTGHGVYALVSAWITQVLATFIGTYGLEKHTIKPLFHYEDSKNAFNIGATVFFINIINWALTNLDRTVLGRLLNPTAVGNYTLAYNLAVMPSNMLMSSLQPAFTAAGAHLSQQRERLYSAYAQIMGAILVLVLPTFAALAVCAPDLIWVMYGDKWTSSGPVLSVLFLAMPLLIVLGVSTPVLANTNKLQQEFWVQVPILCAAIPAFYLLTTSPVSAAIIALAVLLFRSLFMVAAALRALDSSSQPILADLCRGVILSALTASMAYGIKLLLVKWNLPIINLVLTGFCGLVALLSIVILVPTYLGPRALSMLQRFGFKAHTENS
jgi:PST family polysaccharide transporter